VFGILGADLGEDLDRLFEFTDIAQRACELDPGPEILGLVEPGGQGSPIRRDRLLFTPGGVVGAGEVKHDVLVIGMLGCQILEVIDGFLVALVVDQALAESESGLQFLLIGHEPTVPPAVSP